MFSSGTEIYETEDYPIPSVRRNFDTPSEGISNEPMPKQSDIRRAYDNDIDPQVISMYQRSIEIQDKLHELKVLYKSSNSYTQKYPTLLADIEAIENELRNIIDNVNYKNILLPKVDMPISKTYQKLNLSKLKTSISNLNGVTHKQAIQSTGMQTVHYSIYLPAAAETITLSSVSKEVTQLEDKITKSIPSMLVNSSFIERINEIEKRILPIDDTHLRNITLNLKMLMTELTNFQRALNRKPEDSFKTHQQLLTGIKRVSDLYQQLEEITNMQVLTKDLLTKIELMKEYYKQTITMPQCLHEIEATNKNLKEIYANQSAMFYKINRRMTTKSQNILSAMTEIDQLMSSQY